MKLRKQRPVITSWCRLVQHCIRLINESSLSLSLSFNPVMIFRSDSQYHALGLLYHLRKNDRLAVTKMLNKFTKSGLKSPFAYCMLIRIASKLLEETEGGYVRTPVIFRTLNLT